MVWMTGYVALRVSAGAGLAALQASLAVVIWSAIGHRAAQASRAMRFAVGVFAVSAITSLGGIAVLSVIDYWSSRYNIDRSTLGLVALTTFVGAGAWDFAVERAARAPRRVLLVGGGASTARLLADLALERDAGLDVVGIVADSVDDSIDVTVPYCGPLNSLPAVVRRLAPDLVVVAVPTDGPEVFEQLLGVADAGFQVVGLPEIYEFAFGRLPVEDLTSAWFMSVLHAYNRPANRFAKRTFDVVVALFGLAVDRVDPPGDRGRSSSAARARSSTGSSASARTGAHVHDPEVPFDAQRRRGRRAGPVGVRRTTRA